MDYKQTRHGFGLVFTYLNSSEEEEYSTIRWYSTKEELTHKYHYYRMENIDKIKRHRLILSPVVEYSWADFDRLF